MKAIKGGCARRQSRNSPKNNDLQADYITVRLSPLNLFYALTAAYWLVLAWGLL
jgi:hypothetical protein